MSQRVYTDEECALVLALDKELGPKVKAVKEQMRDELLFLEESSGVERIACKVGGTKVGEVGIRRTKPKVSIMPGMEREAIALLDSMGLCELKPVKGWEDSFEIVGRDVVSRSGEVVDCLTFSEPATTAAVRGFKVDDVRDAFQAAGIQIESVQRNLLGGAE